VVYEQQLTSILNELAQLRVAIRKYCDTAVDKAEKPLKEEVREIRG